jgi:hypothetical protein
MLLFLILAAQAVAQAATQGGKHSLVAPFRPGAQQTGWEVSAGAYFSKTYCRLTPDKQSRTGILWNAFRVTMTDWEVEFDFLINGKKSYGGDGFAFWFTEQKSLMGHVFGSADYWKGLAIVFDSYNNDGQGESPLIAAFDNDGTQQYDAATDGGSLVKASCSMPFRNKLATAKIRYVNGLLSVEVALGATRLATDQQGDSAQSEPQFDDKEVKNFRKCFEHKIELGIDKYFGFSAHTGDVADSHDIYRVKTTDLTPAGADLSVVRERYRTKIAQDFALPKHETLTANEFQHLALNLLHQNQEALSLVEDLVNQGVSELDTQIKLHSCDDNDNSNAPAGLDNGPWMRQTGNSLAENKQLAQQVLQTVNQMKGSSLTASELQNQLQSLRSLVQQNQNTLSTLLTNQAQSGGGESWLTTLLLLVITGLVGFQVAQGCGNRGGAGRSYGKLV